MNSEKQPEFKKSFENYIDVTLGIINFLIIIFPLILANKNIYVSITGFFLSGLLLLLAILYFFLRDNPFYIYYC